jgi:cytochrome P450
MLMSDIPALADLRQDPYPTYARLRAEAPVFYSEADQAWLISRYHPVLQVMRASHEFTNRHSGL